MVQWYGVYFREYIRMYPGSRICWDFSREWFLRLCTEKGPQRPVYEWMEEDEEEMGEGEKGRVIGMSKRTAHADKVDDKTINTKSNYSQYDRSINNNSMLKGWEHLTKCLESLNSFTGKNLKQK